MSLSSIVFARSRRMACFAILMAASTGSLSIALISLINATIRNCAFASFAIVWIFAALCVARLIAGAVSQWLLIRLSQDAVRDLRLRLCRHAGGFGANRCRVAPKLPSNTWSATMTTLENWPSGSKRSLNPLQVVWSFSTHLYPGFSSFKRASSVICCFYLFPIS
jgi:hypothetical protein